MAMSLRAAGSIEMQRAWNEQRLESTSTIGTTGNTALSAGAIAGIVIGTGVVVIAVIVTIILVRYYLCFCFDRRKALSTDFTVSYTRSELDSCDSSPNCDPKTLVATELDNCGFEGMKNISSNVASAEPEFATERRGQAQMELSDGEQEDRGTHVRRSCHLDRGMASAIAAQKNRETSVPSVFGDSPDLNDCEQDVVIVYRARTAL